MEAIKGHGTLAAPDLTEPHRALVSARDQLDARTNAQHGVREPWGV